MTAPEIHYSPKGPKICSGRFVRDGWTEIDTPEDWAFIYPRWVCDRCGYEHIAKYDPETGDTGYKIDPEGGKTLMAVEQLSLIHI